MADFVFQFLWGLVVLSGFIGWGYAAAKAAGQARPDWGLSAGWGMAAVLAMGGVLSLFGLAYPPVLVAVVLIGAGLHCVAALRQPSSFLGPLRGLSKLELVLIGLAVIALLTRYTAAVTHQAMNCSDDDVAYFTFVAQLLQTGTMIEPFSLRRLSGYGGQSLLQALIVGLGTEDNGFLMDRGIAVMIAFGLVAGFFRKNVAGLSLAVVAASILILILPYRLMNSSSHITGVVMFLTLFRTLYLIEQRDDAPLPRLLWLAGLVAAAATSLKAHFIAAAGLTVFIYWGLSVVRGSSGWRDDVGRHAVSLGHLGGSTLVFLGAWMALMARSSGTILFPVFQGNHQPEFSQTYSGSMDFSDMIGFQADFFLSPQVALFTLPVALYALRRGPSAGLALFLGTLITMVITVSTLIYDSPEALHRYVSPFLNAAFVSTIIFYLDSIRRDVSGDAAPGRRIGDGILVVLVLALLPVPIYHDINRFKSTLGKTVMTDSRRAAYVKMQDAVPEGEAVFAVLDQPFALDYRRNRVFNVDIPGAASPDPGMPFFKGPGPLKDYLLGQSIAFVAFRDFDIKGGCLYRRGMWKFQACAGHPMWGAQSKYYLDLMDNVAALAKTEKMVYQGDGLFVIGLR